MMPQLARLCLTLAFAGSVAGFASAQSLTVTGQAGYLGEWELSADVSVTPAAASASISARSQ